MELILRLEASYFKVISAMATLFFGTTRRKSEVKNNIYYLDIFNPQYDLEQFPKFSVVFICAYVSSMSECNDNTQSEIVNVQGILDIAKFFLNKGAFVIFLSSNAVFNKNQNYALEADFPDPITIYGKQKHAVENQLIKMTAKDCIGKLAIVRMTKILTHELPLFKKWGDAIGTIGGIQAFEDLKIAPISLEFAVDCLKKISKLDGGGIFHLSGDAEISYLEIGKRFCEILGGLSDGIISQKVDPNNPSMQNSISMKMDATKKILGISPEKSENVVENALNFLKIKIYRY